MWLTLSLISAFFLGLYDVSKKHAVHGNAVFPVLFFATLSASVCTLPIILLSPFHPELARQFHLFIPSLPPSIHLLIVSKSVIVGTSWVLSYFGLKHLPITIATPLRATAPLFTVLGAVVLFGERPTPLQWIGIILILSAYLLYSLSTGKNGNPSIRFIWILFMILAAITGAVSAGFDKVLLQEFDLPPLFVLSWFLFYLTIIFGIIAMTFWYPRKSRFTPFIFRPGILLVGVLLVIADTVYMNALADPEAKLALVSSIRRSNVIISFIGGAVLFHEGNIRNKIIPFTGILAGLFLILRF
jgi:bacterial/archaeal transporter family protein